MNFEVTYGAWYGSLKYNYYSFYIGHPESTSSNWIFVDCKFPGRTLKEAIMLHYISGQYTRFQTKYGFSKIFKPELPPKIVLDMYRCALEYEKKFTPQYGKTREQYKVFKTWRDIEIRKLF